MFHGNILESKITIRPTVHLWRLVFTGAGMACAVGDVLLGLGGNKIEIRIGN
eukprot:m.222832 g.222832  ORF g.222832 m.222832 type:complete len:52 (+) comp15940_c0_seq1:1514-1669(+)